jgi:phospholipid transport system substrate-binding protein
MSHRMGTVWVMALGLLAGSIQVQSQTQAATQPVSQDVTAYELVENTTILVMDVVGSAEDYVDEDPERYYKQVESILDPLIDYRGFARKVMGPYASSKRYRSLDDAGKQQLREQLDQFTEVMRLSLVRTYSKGLLAFGDARIEVEEPDSSQDPARTSVRQLIYVDNPEPYVVMYQMGLEKTGDWKLRNVIIENVNLGEIYRDQFLASARQFDGDLEEVIENWSTVTVEVES